jgi:hypothetical protein
MKTAMFSRPDPRFTFNLDRRSGKDRRMANGASSGKPSVRGRRRLVRRLRDRKAIFRVDHYSSKLFGFIAAILMLSVADAYLTMFLLSQGAVEVNPLMAFYINIGPQTFMAVKYALTSFSVFIILMFGNVSLRGLKFNPHTLFPIIITAFFSVVCWQIYLVLRVLKS